MNALETRALNKYYADFRLEAITLSLPTGGIMGLVGENGAGKTTLIKLLLGIVQPYSGEVFVLGQKAGDRKSKQDIGVVLDQMGFPDCLTAAQVGYIMDGIYPQWEPETYHALLHSLEVPQDQAFSSLSKGTKMKLGIAAAMSHAPKLLILDEPTAGLDPVARSQVMELLYDFTREPTHSVLISSHFVGDLERLCDYVAFLHKGKLLLSEEKDRLLEGYGILRCPPEALSALPPQGVLFLQESAYGTEAVVRRDLVPESLCLSPVGLEDLFVAMVRGNLQ